MSGKTTIAITVFFLLSVLIAPAFAAPAVWTDSIDLADSPVYLSRFSENNYIFEVDIAETGFDPGPDPVDEYSLNTGLSDDGDGAREFAYINLPGLLSDQVIEVDYGNYGFDMSIAGLSSFNETGIPEASLSALWGDFRLNSMQFHGNRNGNSVPLPSSILLLGTGLLVLTGVRCRLGRSFS